VRGNPFDLIRVTSLKSSIDLKCKGGANLASNYLLHFEIVKPFAEFRFIVGLCRKFYDARLTWPYFI
jgi:hypothetical protein